MQREAFSECPFSASRQILQKELDGHKSLPWELLEPGKMGSCHRRGGSIPRQTLSQTIIPPIYSSPSPFVFPKIHLLSPKRPAALPPSSVPFPIRWYLILNSKPLQRVAHFSLGISHVYTRYTCFCTCVCFSSVNLYHRGLSYALRRVEGKFLPYTGKSVSPWARLRHPASHGPSLVPGAQPHLIRVHRSSVMGLRGLVFMSMCRDSQNHQNDMKIILS